MDITQKILSDIVVHMKYARHLPEKERRETWEELVLRNMDMHIAKFPQLEDEIRQVYTDYVLTKKVLPSMRSLQFAGKPIELAPTRIFNCAFAPVDDWRVFSEILFLLLGGTGVGYSVQRHDVEKLPEIRKPNINRTRRYLVGDSIEGWSDAIKMLFKNYFFGGPKIVFDYRDIRPKGMRLITSGGKAPGPQPLKECIVKIEGILDSKQDGDKLTSLEVHDCICHIADGVLAGGIRRCLPYNSLVHTSRGLVQMCEINVGDEVLNKDGNFDKVLAWEYTGEKELTHIITELGVFKSSKDHRWAVLDTLSGDVIFKEAQHLSSDDTLMMIPVDIDGIQTELPEFNFKKKDADRNSIDIKIPKLDTDIAWLIGLIHGDGCIESTGRKKSISIAFHADQEIEVQKAKSILERFGVNVRANHSTDEKCTRLNCTSRQLNEYLSQFKKPKKSIKIPPFILQGTRDIRLAYLAGVIDSDGSCSSTKVGRKTMRVLSSVYEDYMRQIRAVIFSLGYPSKYRIADRNHVGWQPIGAVDVVGTENKDKFANDIKQYSFKVQRDYNFEPFKAVSAGLVVPKKQLRESTIKMSHKSTYAGNTNTYKSWYSFENEFGTQSYSPVRIKSVIVESGEVTETYDIQVENSEMFVCEGMLVHNSALISLFNVDDDEMLSCKTGNWWELNPQRGRANNSAVLVRHKLTREAFDSVWDRLKNSGSGEPGIFLTNNDLWGTNPCCEVSLRPFQMCNLTEINASDVVDQDDLNARAKAAAFIGTLQASYTDFHYLRPIWRRTVEKDALLGVGMTGIASGKVNNLNLTEATNVVTSENKRIAKIIGIRPAARTTCVKPSGTTSTVLGCSSGIHAWHSDYYIRRVRVNKNEAIYTYLSIHHPELLEDEYFRPHDTAVISIPQRAPKGSVTREESEIELLERVKKFYTEWIKPGHISGDNTHNVSATISVRDENWDSVGEWVWENRDSFSGLSFLPFSDHTYKQAPFEDITEDEFNRLVQTLKDIDLTKVIELDDNTDLRGEIACSGGSTCEIQ